MFYIAAPVINTSTVEVITSVNQPTTLFIETTGNPPAEIEWSKDGCPVNHPIMSDGSLYIMHTEPSDQGEYTVTATNPVGSSRQVITVTVIQPVTLHCKIFIIYHLPVQIAFCYWPFSDWLFCKCLSLFCLPKQSRSYEMVK